MCVQYEREKMKKEKEIEDAPLKNKILLFTVNENLSDLCYLRDLSSCRVVHRGNFPSNIVLPHMNYKNIKHIIEKHINKQFRETYQKFLNMCKSNLNYAS